MMRAAEYATGLRRLTLVWLSAVTLMVLTLVALQSYLEREQMRETVTSAASVIGSNAAAAIVFNDAAAGAEMLSAFRASDYVLEAAFYREDGSRLAEFHGAGPLRGDALGVLAPPHGEAFSLRELRVALPIMLNDRAIGTIALRASLDSLYSELLRFAGGLAGVSVFAVAFASLATHRLRRRLAEKEVARRHAEGELAQSRDQLRQMMVHREQLLEEEHKRISIEIHDQLGQLLTAAMLNLRSLERSLTLDEDAKRQLEEVLGQLDESYYGMKNIATLLYPAVLKFGFRPAIEWLAGRLLKVAGIQWHMEVEEPFPALEAEQSMGLFRIVQEALVNIVHHAHAGNVRISLRHDEQGIVSLEIADDGCGFDAGNGGQRAGFGLIGMRERAESLGGHVTIASRPGDGTTVRVTIPLVAARAPTVGSREQTK